jgi:hypothetical protein
MTTVPTTPRPPIGSIVTDVRTGATWRVVGRDDKAGSVSLSGPGPCRGMAYVEEKCLALGRDGAWRLDRARAQS